MLKAAGVGKSTEERSGKKIGAKNSARRRFTEDEARALRQRHAGGTTAIELARESKMAITSMRYLLNGTTYAWVRASPCGARAC